uniref:Uncharacterized protein n=1 Tax=Glossina palpalis gambiensis TaxID=67801 RepID=A0A1B0BN27_9MUSC
MLQFTSLSFQIKAKFVPLSLPASVKIMAIVFLEALFHHAGVKCIALLVCGIMATGMCLCPVMLFRPCLDSWQSNNSDPGTVNQKLSTFIPVTEILQHIRKEKMYPDFDSTSSPSIKENIIILSSQKLLLHPASSSDFRFISDWNCICGGVNKTQTSICAYLCFCAIHVIASNRAETAHLKKQNAINSLSHMHLRFRFRRE